MKKVALLIGMILCLLVVFSGCGGGAAGGGDKEPNNTIGEANSVSLDKTFPITINPEEDRDWFKVELPEQGYLKIQAGEVPEELGLEVAFSLYQEWEDEKEKRLRGWKRLPDAVSIPKKGTYYFVIKDDYDDAFSKEAVNIKATFIKEFDSYEPNNSPEKAAEVSTGSVVKPAIFPVEDEDWFKVTVEEQGYLQIQSKNVPEDIEPEVLYATYDEWADPKVKELRSWNRLPDACFIPDSGDYLIRLHDDYDDASSESNFDLKIDFLEEMDKNEPNDHFRNAKEIIRGDTLTVAIYPREDKDYYRIESEEAGKLRIKSTGSSQDIVPEFKLFIRDKENPDRLKEAGEWKRSPAEYEVKGNVEYFLLIHDDYDDRGSPEAFKVIVE